MGAYNGNNTLSQLKNRLIMKIFLIITLCLSSYLKGISQEQNVIDSLRNVIETPEQDNNTIAAYILLGEQIYMQQPDSAVILWETAEKMAELLIATEPAKEIDEKAKEYLAAAINNIGYIYNSTGNTYKAIEYFNKSLNIQEEVGDKRGMALSFNNIGYIYHSKGDIPNTLIYYQKSLSIYQELEYKQGMASSFNNIGTVYDDQGDITKALEYYQKSLNIREEIKDKKGIALAFNNIGLIYQKQGDNQKSLEYYLKSLSIRKEIGDKRGIAQTFNNIGNIYYRQGNASKAIKYYQNSLNISEEVGDKYEMCTALFNLGRVSKYQNNVLQFEKYATRSYEMSKELGFPYSIENAAYLMKDLSVLQGNYKKALEYYQEEIAMRDSLQNEENYKQTQKQQARYEYEKQAAVDSIAHAKAIEIKNLDIVRIEEEKKAQAAQRNMLIVGLGLMIVLAIFIFRSYKHKKRANVLLAEQKHEIEEKNEELNQQNEEILTQRDEIEQQRDIVIKQKDRIEEIHGEITSSIRYAERIQSAILATEKYLLESVTEHFILFKPRDVVSGDFYFVTKLNKYLIVAAADCTGHGVPGAFMSMMGTAFLSEIVNKKHITQTHQVLNELRSKIITALNQKSVGSESKDGMDISLCAINLETNICQFAGANNPLYVVKGDKITQIKGDKMPIAIYDRMYEFTTHEIQLEKGDTLYMFSDGYADQFGGPNDKKFMYKPFKQLLLDNVASPMFQQKEILNETFETWKGNNDQIDDVLVIGIKI